MRLTATDWLQMQTRLRTAGGGEVAYVRLHFFASETTRAVQAALLAGEQDGVDGYILDLRNNPGGCLNDRNLIAVGEAEVLTRSVGQIRSVADLAAGCARSLTWSATAFSPHWSST